MRCGADRLEGSAVRLPKHDDMKRVASAVTDDLLLDVSGGDRKLHDHALPSLPTANQGNLTSQIETPHFFLHCRVERGRNGRFGPGAGLCRGRAGHLVPFFGICRLCRGDDAPYRAIGDFGGSVAPRSPFSVLFGAVFFIWLLVRQQM